MLAEQLLEVMNDERLYIVVAPSRDTIRNDCYVMLSKIEGRITLERTKRAFRDYALEARKMVMEEASAEMDRKLTLVVYEQTVYEVMRDVIDEIAFSTGALRLW